MKTTIARVFRCVLVPLLTAAVIAPAAQAIPTLGLSATPVSVEEGDAFRLDVTVADIADLFAWQFDVEFAPSLVTAQSSAEGSFLAGGGSTFYIDGVIDNTLGAIGATSASLLSAVSGVSGDGVLASFYFAAANEGNALFTLSNVILLDSMFGDLQASLGNLSVTIGPRTPPTDVPEPNALAMFLAGACVLGVLRAHRRAIRG